MAKINAFNTQKGWIEVICGPMFSGKSEELLRRVNLLQYSEVEYLLFTPATDTRSGAKKAKSRDGRVIESITVQKAIDIIDHVNKATGEVQLIAIDEAQFFDEGLCDVVNHLANHGYVVMVAGLDMDSWGKPFRVMERLLASAERVTKLKAVCVHCGATASFSDHIDNRDVTGTNIVVGDSNEYVACCRKCHKHLKDLTSSMPPVKEAKN